MRETNRLGAVLLLTAIWMQGCSPGNMGKEDLDAYRLTPAQKTLAASYFRARGLIYEDPICGALQGSKEFVVFEPEPAPKTIEVSIPADGRIRVDAMPAIEMLVAPLRDGGITSNRHVVVRSFVAIPHPSAAAEKNLMLAVLGSHCEPLDLSREGATSVTVRPTLDSSLPNEYSLFYYVAKAGEPAAGDFRAYKTMICVPATADVEEARKKDYAPMSNLIEVKIRLGGPGIQ